MYKVSWLAAVLCTTATAQTENGEAEQWAQLRTQYEEAIAAHDAVPYSPTYRPGLFSRFKKQLAQIEPLRRRFVQRLLDTKRCEAVEMVQIDPVESTPDGLHFVLDCADGSQYRASAAEILQGAIPDATKQGVWSEARARQTCRDIVRANAQRHETFEIVDQQVNTDAEDTIHIALYYRAGRGKGKPKAAKAQCVFAPGEYPRVSISEN